jgi:hypothetical protein
MEDTTLNHNDINLKMHFYLLIMKDLTQNVIELQYDFKFTNSAIHLLAYVMNNWNILINSEIKICEILINNTNNKNFNNIILQNKDINQMIEFSTYKDEDFQKLTEEQIYDHLLGNMNLDILRQKPILLDIKKILFPKDDIINQYLYIDLNKQEIILTNTEFNNNDNMYTLTEDDWITSS